MLYQLGKLLTLLNYMFYNVEKSGTFISWGDFYIYGILLDGYTQRLGKATGYRSKLLNAECKIWQGIMVERENKIE